MNTVASKKPNVINAIADFISSDLLQEEIQTLPNDLQEIFELVLDTDAGNCLKTRRKMLRIKELSMNFAKKLAPFTDFEIQESCIKHQI
jgi:hypothetical protein